MVLHQRLDTYAIQYLSGAGAQSWIYQHPRDEGTLGDVLAESDFLKGEHKQLSGP